ncbi:MAG: ArsR family transcriptional regulator [Bacteroidota bacterium]
MIESLITSKTRIKLLLKFFFNSQTKSYLRSLEKEFGESSNAIRIELNRFEEAGMLKSEYVGNRKYFQANTKHPLYNDVNNILKKIIGIDKIIDRITSQIGDLEAAYVTGDFAKGRDSKIIDLVLVGKNLDNNFIGDLVEKAQELIDRKIRYIILTGDQMQQIFNQKPALLIWKQDQ